MAGDVPHTKPFECVHNVHQCQMAEILRLGPQAQQTEDGAEEEQSCEKLVRIPIEELQDQPESKS